MNPNLHLILNYQLPVHWIVMAINQKEQKQWRRLWSLFDLHILKYFWSCSGVRVGWSMWPVSKLILVYFQTVTVKSELSLRARLSNYLSLWFQSLKSVLSVRQWPREGNLGYVRIIFLQGYLGLSSGRVWASSLWGKKGVRLRLLCIKRSQIEVVQ